ncbi:MAG: LamG-like jellyroll fold domain-containing protein, partial [Pseudomonadota bacterium]
WQPGAGRLGGALTFGGGDDAVDLGAFDVSGEGLTLAAWLFVDSVAGIGDEARVISKATGVSGDDHLWMLGLYEDGTALRFRLNTASGGTTTLGSPTGVVPAGAWVHVAAVYDGSEMRLYADGSLAASVAKTGSLNQAPGAGVALGNQPAGLTNRGLIGRLDDAVILGEALDEDGLALLMAGLPASGNCADPSADCDGDGLEAAVDNCLDVPNPAQRDTDGDGYGNFCDPDFNNDCAVNALDLAQLRELYFTDDAETDLNGDGAVNALDLGLVRERFFTVPGPSLLGTCPTRGDSGREAAGTNDP